MGGETCPYSYDLLAVRCEYDSVLTYDPEIVREKVQDGVTGETRELQYTNCKIVGNGSFGVVFQTKLSPSGEDAAIKRVLQDKRFKVNKHDLAIQLCHFHGTYFLGTRTVSSRSCVSYDIPILSS